MGGAYCTLNQKLFFFLFVWIEGLESFIIQDDKNIIEKILKHIEKTTRTDKKIDV